MILVSMEQYLQEVSRRMLLVCGAFESLSSSGNNAALTAIGFWSFTTADLWSDTLGIYERELQFMA